MGAVTDVDEELIAVDGIVATGVHGVAVAPTDSTTALGGTWVDHGLTTDAGVTRSQPVTANVRRGWQNRQKRRRIVTEAAVRFQFVLVQTNSDSVQLFHGLALTAGSIITDPGREWPLIAFDIDMFDENDVNGVIREYAPSARVVEVGDQVALAGDGWGWPITVEAEYDTDLGGYTKQFYSKYETVAVPTISAAIATAAAEGEFVQITGTGFSTVTGATGVKFGATNATSYERSQATPDTIIYAKVPAGSAGAANIVVTNAGGASAAFSYTRGA